MPTGAPPACDGTRAPLFEAARALAAAGAAVVQADLDQPESLAATFDGAHGVFGVTNFWEHMDADRGLTQGRAILDAARDAGVEYLVWSSLEDTRELSPLGENMPIEQGQYNVPHMDTKGSLARGLLDSGAPTTILLTSFYWENYIGFGMQPVRDDDGVLTLTMPIATGKLPGIAVEDIGRFAYEVFHRRDEFVGREIAISGENLTGFEIAAKFAAAVGEDVRYNPISLESYRGLGFPGAEDLGNMFYYKELFIDRVPIS